MPTENWLGSLKGIAGKAGRAAGGKAGSEGNWEGRADLAGKTGRLSWRGGKGLSSGRALRLFPP